MAANHLGRRVNVGNVLDRGSGGIESSDEARHDVGTQAEDRDTQGFQPLPGGWDVDNGFDSRAHDDHGSAGHHTKIR